MAKRAPFFHSLIASGFGSGFSPVAPGTAGALLATAIWLILYNFLSFDTLFIVTLVLVILFTILGIYSSNVLEPYWGEDPSKIVVDEMVGVWIPLLGVPDGNIWYVVASFILFRFFDILKPLGIRKMENLNGGVGVMMDDILSGIYSLIIILGIRWVVG